MTEALRLLLIGMSTVFSILIIVVLLGNLIIQITNKFTPTPLAPTVSADKKNATIDSAKLAAIFSAVEVASKGKAKITTIQKMDV